MSKPRKPYGANPPGRLLGTMIKVLAAEMSDQSRLARGKRYWAEDAVLDIVVGHGAVTAEIQGSRSQPYVVTIEASGGSGVPTRREVWAQCTCPDDTGTGVDLCKHAVAAFFALADEVTIEPELVDRWRASARRRTTGEAGSGEVAELPVRGPDAGDAEDVAEDADKADETDDRLAGPRDGDDLGDGDDGDDDDDGGGRMADVIELRPARDASSGAIATMLAAPAGSRPPELPEVTELDHGPLADRRLAEVLGDALDHLAIRWE